MDNFESRYQKLNSKQKEAVDTLDGPLLVVAGPGSGKTELLSLRTANILKSTDTPPNNILLLTFTDSAAYNMRERLANLIGERAYKVNIYTFHSLATDIISKYPYIFFDGAKFLPATEVDQHNVVEDIVKNLPRKNPLSSYHPEQGYVYVRDIISGIRDLKRGNYTPETYRAKIKENIKNFKSFKKTFNELLEISGKSKYEIILPAYISAYENLKKIVSKEAKNEVAKSLVNSLSLSIKKAKEDGSGKPLTQWKNTVLEKDEDGKFILKDSNSAKIERLQALSEVYEKYQIELQKRAIFDFEDMILLANKALSEHKELRADLQEKYQYIMIDEFQDTNAAQFQFVLELSKSIVNGKRPNVLVVGDDDQAIFKFQGAEINNIYSFIGNFDNVKMIVLDKNYRSTQDILNFAREIILKAEDRLEVRDKSIRKDIASENKNLPKGGVTIEKFLSNEAEYEFVAQEIQKLLQNKVNPKEIAVICRKHEELKNLSNVLSVHKVPYSYEKRENVLEKQHIFEIITILKYIVAAQDGHGEELIPTIFSFKFFGLNTLDVWELAEEVREGELIEDETGEKNYKKKSWLKGALNSENKKIKEIAEFLVHLTVTSKSTPLEYLIDEIIGTTEFLWDDSEHSDSDILVPRNLKGVIYKSPYKNYYFNSENFAHDKAQYLEFLSSLRTFIGALREFHQGRVLYASDIINFINTYNGQNLTLSAISPFASSNESISLLTAHKAKGLEFEYVFLLAANDRTWKRGGFASKISFPQNMGVGANKDNDDDKIRLLYVALTRTKHTLYITHSEQKLEYLIKEGEEKEKRVQEEVTNKTLKGLSIVPNREFVNDEKILLKRIIENYKMPVTHFNNFLNFTRVGPMRFVEQNLLRFPQAITPSGAYGSAMHEAVERYFLYYARTGKTPDLEFMKNVFEQNLNKSRLPEHDHKKYLEDGNLNLKTYFDFLSKKKILPNTKVETKFANEGVKIDEAHLTGNIDKMEFFGSEIIVTDLKTGESFDSWDTDNLNEYSKIKLHFFKYQLVFYSILIKNSKNYSSYNVKVGNIEFIEADQNKRINILPLAINIDDEEKLKKLINIVYKKIIALEFPDTSKYSENLKGILEFEEDLLNGNI